MYITGTKFNFINRLHQLPINVSDLQSFENELGNHIFSGILELHVVNKINSEFQKKYYSFTLDFSYLTGIYAQTGVSSGSAPINIILPFLSGHTYQSATLYINNGQWSNTNSFLYQWQINDINISGANNNYYVIQPTDSGILSCIISGMNSYGNFSLETSGFKTNLDSYFRKFNFNNTNNRLEDLGDHRLTSTGFGTINYTNDQANLNTGQYINLGKMDYLSFALNNNKLILEADITTSGGTTKRIFGTENLPNNVGDTLFCYLNIMRTGSNAALHVVGNTSGALYTLLKFNGIEAWASITGVGATNICDHNPHTYKCVIDAKNSGINFYIDNIEITQNKTSIYSGFSQITTGFDRDFYCGAMNDAGGTVGYLSGSIDNLLIYTSGYGNRPNGLRYTFGNTNKISTLNDTKHNGFPMVGVWRKSDSYYGRIVLFYREDENHAGYYGRIKCIWSDDHGVSWSSPKLMISGIFPIDYREGAIQERPNGGLFMGIGWRQSGSATGNAEIYNVNFDVTGSPYFDHTGIIYPPSEYQRIKHCTSIIEVSSNNWLAAAGSFQTGHTDIDALIFKSIDSGNTWTLHKKVARQSDWGAEQAENAIYPDPLNSGKLWMNVRDTSTEDRIRRFYSIDGPNYDTWTYYDTLRGVFGSPRMRVIDRVAWGTFRDYGQNNYTNVIYSLDGINCHSMGRINKTITPLVLLDLMTYGQVIKTVSGELLAIHGTQASNTNGDILITQIRPI